MKWEHTILVTGADGAAVPDLLFRLRSRWRRVLACDCDPLVRDFYPGEEADVRTVPRGESLDYLPSLRQLCEIEEIQAIVPLVDEELESVLELERRGIVVLCPRPDFVRTCLDKWECMKNLKTIGITVPDTFLRADVMLFSAPIGRDLVVKPRRGHGSRDVRIVRKGTSDAELRSLPLDTLIQEYVDGTEYTVSVVCWRDDQVRAVVPKRIISKQGVTRLAITERNEEIDRTCRKIAEALKPGGPFNVQGRMNAKGKFCVFEINPRFSGTVNLTIGAGCDEVSGLLELALMGTVDNRRFAPWQEGVRLVRRYCDCVL